MRLVAQFVTTGPFCSRKHMVQAERQRVFLADVAARLVDDRQAIGVGVLAEADVGLGRDDLLPQRRPGSPRSARADVRIGRSAGRRAA